MNNIEKFLMSITLVIALDSSAIAQKEYSNTLNFSLSYFNFPKFADGSWVPMFFLPTPFTRLNFGDQFSVAYERKVYKNLRVGIGYTTWNMVPSLNKLNYQGGAMILGDYLYGIPGALEYRRAYKMFDYYLQYKFKYLKKHRITLGAGGSYAWGVNHYIDTIYYNPNPPYDADIISHDENGHFNGLIASLSYDYSLLKNRISIGPDLKWRKYFHLYGYQIDYGVHVLLNF